jgi:hypothetical protein
MAANRVTAVSWTPEKFGKVCDSAAKKSARTLSTPGGTDSPRYLNCQLKTPFYRKSINVIPLFKFESKKR